MDVYLGKKLIKEKLTIHADNLTDMEKEFRFRVGSILKKTYESEWYNN
jgi:hypothetical protein